MKAINEYINESIRLDEAKKINASNLLDGLDKVEDWNKADNIKKLMSEYMSAGDAEDLDSKHWTVCVEVVEYVLKSIRNFIDENSDGVINFKKFFTTMDDLTDYVTDDLESNNEKFIDDLNKKDKDGDWDVDACIDLFNTVSMKVCKEAWLI